MRCNVCLINECWKLCSVCVRPWTCRSRKITIFLLEESNERKKQHTRNHWTRNDKRNSKLLLLLFFFCFLSRKIFPFVRAHNRNRIQFSFKMAHKIFFFCCCWFRYAHWTPSLLTHFRTFPNEFEVGKKGSTMVQMKKKTHTQQKRGREEQIAYKQRWRRFCISLLAFACVSV